jgi:protein transport protein SEC61 subunit gamma-like protein
MGLKQFIAECKRVFIITRKPTKQEFWKILKVSAIGIFIIGLMGFLILLMYELIFSSA